MNKTFPDGVAHALKHYGVNCTLYGRCQTRNTSAQHVINTSLKHSFFVFYNIVRCLYGLMFARCIDVNKDWGEISSKKYRHKQVRNLH